MSPSTVTEQPRDSRYHDLDALRAFAILVVILFHTGGLASGFPVPGGKPGAWTLRWCVSTAHAFQMPVFFMMSGFFGAMAVARSGAERFARNRLTRIGIPLVVGWIAMVPLLNAIAVWGQHLRGAHTEPVGASTLFNQKLHHLWFLWYLLMFCALVLAIRALAARRPAVEAGVRRVFGGVVESRWRLPVLVLLTTAILIPAPLWTIAVPPVITPDADPFVYFGLFFGFGWLLYGQRELLPRLRAAPLLHILVAFAMSIAVIVILESGPSRHDQLAHFAVITATALVTWTAILGLLGFFHRWFSRSNPRVRYASDAAYFLYLGHLPLVTAGWYSLTELGAPFWIKLFGVPVATIAVLLLAYDRLVRYTAVGRVLHGPRARSPQAVGAEGS